MLFMVKKTATKRGIQLVVTDVEPKKPFWLQHSSLQGQR